MKLLSTREFSELIGVSRETLKKQRQRKSSPYKYHTFGRKDCYESPQVRQKPVFDMMRI